MKYRTLGTDPHTRREVSALALGAMLFGSATDEKTSFAVLDRYVEAGGNCIDTSDNYAFRIDGSQGGQSEELLGRWRRSRGIGDEIVIATKLGARPLAPGTSYVDNAEGLSAKVIRESAERSRERLGVAKLDLLYAHIEDHTVTLQETVEGFAALVAEGTVGLLGVSNHTIWRVERARALAATGHPRQARETFERVLAVRNDLGLLAEQWDLDAGRQLGSAPQAFSHIALVETA
jgi:aryl-alcohol dehydrogenase-like predicted oxidoreductase